MFEFDPDKSASNFAKHGIDFETAQALWEDEQRVEAPTYSGGDYERVMIVSMIKGELWTATVTLREAHVRIISVRRARTKEAKAYG